MDYPKQIDCVWLASDSTGQLAAMITAGEGPIPAEVLKGGYLFEIEEWLFQLGTVGQAKLIASVPDPESFVNLGERGLFVYDWTDAHSSSAQRRGKYELVCSPENLLMRDVLPTALQAVVFEIDAALGIPFVSVG